MRGSIPQVPTPPTPDPASLISPGLIHRAEAGGAVNQAGTG